MRLNEQHEFSLFALSRDLLLTRLVGRSFGQLFAHARVSSLRQHTRYQRAK